MPEIPDAAEREQALDITHSYIVEAPAGSGKTGLLIQRYLKLLASENVTDPGQILAITFTRKATAEMQQRVLAQLTAARDATPPTNPFDVQTRPFAEAVLVRDSALDWHLIDSPRSLRIRTIDSVSAEIARGLPILSGSGGGVTPSEDAGTLHAQAAHRTLMLLGGSSPQLSAALETLLLHRDGNLADCESLIARMLATRDQWGTLVPLAADHLTDHYLDTTILPQLEKALEQAICRALTRLTYLIPPGILTRLCALAAEMAQAEGYKGAPSPIALCKSRFSSPQDRAEDLDHWRALIHLLVKPSKPRDWRKSLAINNIGFAILKSHKAELLEIIADVSAVEGLVDELCAIDSLPPASYPPEQWLVTKALFRVLSRALVELQFVFAGQNTCDFAELGLLARTALRRDTALDDLRTAAGMELQHLLVDEMQDTSSAQYELIQLLTQRWDGHGQTVFLVGDPKQSIYLFRQARVERFLHTLHTQRLGDLPLTALHLTANFRSQRTLVEHFNQDFSQVFPAPTEPMAKPGAPGLASETWAESPQKPGSPLIASSAIIGIARPPTHEVPFRQAHAMRPSTEALARVWHTEALPYAARPDDRATLRITKSRDHASLTARIINRWRLSPHSTIAVLVRGRTHLLDIVKAFQSASIPYRAVEIEPLAERQEILDLLALTRALLHPADRTAWLAILRAPWCGLALADLHTLTGQDSPAYRDTNIVDLVATRGDLLSPDAIARLEPFWSVMQAALAQRGTMPLTTLVERTWQAFAAPLVLPAEALTNAAHYFQLLSELERQFTTLSLTTLSQRIGDLYATPATHPGAVDLMTIHKSKGLEWDVVFVPALEKTGRTTSTNLISWLELAPPGVPQVVSSEAQSNVGAIHSQPVQPAPGILAPIQARGKGSSQLIAWMRSIESTREAAERKRLFYVACTRAREELHLFAAPALSSKGEVKPKSDSLLHAAWSAAEANIVPPVAAIPSVLDTLAATGMPQDRGAESKVIAGAIPIRILQRIPRSLLPTTLFISPPAPPPAFSRPEGSFAARAFGNTMHTLLDLLATQLAKGYSPESLLVDLATWTPRTVAVLRAAGLAPQHLQRFTTTLLRGLANTLSDPAGLWLLSPHPESRSESTLTSPTGTLRLDRTFLAGPTPGSHGTTHLWIVDYKTATPVQANLEDFLAEERQKYQPQLATYAQALVPKGLPIRLALYHPMLPNLTWWPPS